MAQSASGRSRPAPANLPPVRRGSRREVDRSVLLRGIVVIVAFALLGLIVKVGMIELGADRQRAQQVDRAAEPSSRPLPAVPR
jgi:hypothetical protein